MVPLRPAARFQRHTAPCINGVRFGKTQDTSRIPAARSKKNKAALAPAASDKSKLQECVCCAGIVCFAIIVLSFPFGMAIIVRQRIARAGAMSMDCKKDLRCRRLTTFPDRPNRTFTTVGGTVVAARASTHHRNMIARTNRAVAARGTKAPTRTPTILRSNLDQALSGISCTSPMRRDRNKRQQRVPEHIPVVIFTHLRRTGGSVLEKGVFWPGVACDQGVVPSPPAPPKLHRTTLGSHLFYKAPVSNTLPPTLAERKATQQVTLACKQEPRGRAVERPPDGCRPPTGLASHLSPVSSPSRVVPSFPCFPPRPPPHDYRCGTQNWHPSCSTATRVRDRPVPFT